MNPEQFRPITPDSPLPTIQEALEMWDRFGMLDNIRAHSLVVRDVALRLTDWLAEGGLALNRRAIETGAILHDIAKTMCLHSERRHDVEGAEIVSQAGFPELSWLVRFHVRLPQAHGVDEATIVNYADKRVRHDEVVDLNQRFAYIAQRYGRGEPLYLQRIEQGRLMAHRVESTLFSLINNATRTPEEITRLWREGQL